MPPGRTRSAAARSSVELELRQRPRAPAQVGPPGEHAEPGARRVDERAVEPGQLRGQRVASALDDGDVRRRRAARRSPRARARGPRGARPRRPRRRAASPCRPAPRRGRASARRRALPTASPASCDPRLCGQMRPSASACSSTRSTRYAPGTSVGSPRRVAADEPDDGLRRLVLRPHQLAAPPRRRARATRARAIQSGYECLSAASAACLRQRRQQRPDPVGEPPHARRS